MDESQELQRLTVKLSKATVDLLKNFSTINKSILIPSMEKTISTMSVNKNIIAMSGIREAFPETLAIYDLPLFLGALSLFNQPMLFFPDKQKVVIYDEETKGKTTFYYADPDIIGAVPEFNPNLPEQDIHFDLPMADLVQLMRASKVYGVEDLCITGYNGEYSICVKDKKNETSNVFSLPLRKVQLGIDDAGVISDNTFCYCFKVENLKLLEGSYHVTISRKNIASFSSLTVSSLDYFIALEPN